MIGADLTQYEADVRPLVASSSIRTIRLIKLPHTGLDGQFSQGASEV